MNVATLGNCQTKVLQVFLRKFIPDFTYKWICIDIFSRPDEHAWAKQEIFYNEFVECIFDVKESVDFLHEADVIIYQKIKNDTSPLFNDSKIRQYAKPSCTLISIQSFHYNSETGEGLVGMRHRHKMNPVTIPVDSLMIKNPLIASEQPPAHPNTHYYIELTREICKINQWPMPNHNDEDFFINSEWPHKKIT